MHPPSWRFPGSFSFTNGLFGKRSASATECGELTHRGAAVHTLEVWAGELSSTGGTVTALVHLVGVRGRRDERPQRATARTGAGAAGGQFIPRTLWNTSGKGPGRPIARRPGQAARLTRSNRAHQVTRNCVTRSHLAGSTRSPGQFDAGAWRAISGAESMAWSSVTGNGRIAIGELLRLVQNCARLLMVSRKRKPHQIGPWWGSLGPERVTRERSESPRAHALDSAQSRTALPPLHVEPRERLPGSGSQDLGARAGAHPKRHREASSRDRG
jgi:hypothetical protein